MTIETRALPTVGVEVLGLDLDGHIDGSMAEHLMAIWHEAGMVLFRDICRSPETLLKLSRCFGELDPHPIESFRLPGYPELISLTNKDGLKGPVYAFDGVPTYGRIPWHTDLAFAEVPNAGALLNMVQKAARGGHTLWLDTSRAHECIGDSLRKRIEPLEARFEFCADLADVKFDNPSGTRVGDTTAKFPDYKPLVRPLVWKHPITGRTIMNICPLNLRGIVGMDQAEGDAVIDELLEAVLQPQFIYEHPWEEGDVVLWDNYRMMHCAMGHPVEVIREAHRTTLRGTCTVGRTLSTDAAVEAA